CRGCPRLAIVGPYAQRSTVMADNGEVSRFTGFVPTSWQVHRDLGCECGVHRARELVPRRQSLDVDQRQVNVALLFTLPCSLHGPVSVLPPSTDPGIIRFQRGLLATVRQLSSRKQEWPRRRLTGRTGAREVLSHSERPTTHYRESWFPSFHR